MARRERPSLTYLVVGGLSWPILRGLYRLRAVGIENLPAAGGYVLSANHTSSFDPWPLGVPLFPRRFLRFMAKSELFWPPLGWIVKGAGGFKVGEVSATLRRSRRAEQLARDGYVVVMFPEGTRRTKGLRKKHVARAHTGAARIALSAGVPLVPAAISVPTGCAPGADSRCLRVSARHRRPPRPASGRRRAGGHRPADGGHLRPRGLADVTRPLLVVDGDSFAHRAYHALPSSIRRTTAGPGNTLVGFTTMLLRLWQAERPRAVVVGWDTIGAPTYRNELLPGYQSGRVFDDDILEQLDLLPGARLRDGDRLRQAGGLRGRRLPRARPSTRRSAVAAARSSRRPIATRSSWRAPRRRSCSRRRASASCGGSVRPRCASGTASSRRRCRDFIALRGRPVRQDSRRPRRRREDRGRAPPAVRLARGAARGRPVRGRGRMRCARTGRSPPSTARRRCPRSRTSSRTGRREPQPPTSSACACSPARLEEADIEPSDQSGAGAAPPDRSPSGAAGAHRRAAR